MARFYVRTFVSDRLLVLHKKPRACTKRHSFCRLFVQSPCVDCCSVPASASTSPSVSTSSNGQDVGQPNNFQLGQRSHYSCSDVGRLSTSVPGVDIGFGAEQR